MAVAADKDTKMAINGPVFFLVQEQAKSVVAIQALQTRMAVLESLQERLMQAIDDVHQHLRTTKDAKAHSVNLKNSSYAKASNLSSGEKKLRFVETGVKSAGTGTKSELSKTDSYNKDSGLGHSDCSLATGDHHSLHESDDELLQLLELIDQKSLSLVKQIEGTPLPVTESSDMDLSSSALLDTLLFEKVNTQRQLSEMKAERDELKERLLALEIATQAVSKQKLKVQKQLDATLIENHSLQCKIRETSDDFERKSESLGYLADIEKANIKRKYMKYSEKSRLKVSSILKETNVLELQKQLLTYVMENDILRAKLQEDEPSKISSWLKIEHSLRKKLNEALDEKQQLKDLLQSKSLEVASLKDRIHHLEDPTDCEDESGVKNFGMASNDDWREPGVYNKRSNLHDNVPNDSPFSPLGYGDFSKTQSLPAMQFRAAQARRKQEESMRVNFDHHVYDTGSFTDVPLNLSSHRFNNETKTESSATTEPHYSSTSTLVQSNLVCQQPVIHSRLSVPNLSRHSHHSALQNWAFASRTSSRCGAKLVNGHLCWRDNATSTRDSHHHQQSSGEDTVTSICSEFDPLSDDNNSACEHFVDSLNLSIPLKPIPVTISQLSSVGDSLHSNSLDLGCSSSPVLYKDIRKVSNARSVDGIRDLLLENGYSKSSLNIGHSNKPHSVLGTTKRPIPVNIMRCMHESPDYSLL